MNESGKKDTLAKLAGFASEIKALEAEREAFIKSQVNADKTSFMAFKKLRQKLVYIKSGKPKVHQDLAKMSSGRPELVEAPNGELRIVTPAPPPTSPSKSELKSLRRKDQLARLEKHLNKHPLSEMTATALGFPGRVRALYHRIDKFAKGGKSMIEIMDEIRPIVVKYLSQRLDIGIYGTLSARLALESFGNASTGLSEIQECLDKDIESGRVSAFDLSKLNLTDAQLVEVQSTLDIICRMVQACNEADALMLLRAEYFLCGITVKFCHSVAGFSYPPHPSVDSLYELINIGSDRSLSRQQRIATATKKLQTMGVELA